MSGEVSRASQSYWPEPHHPIQVIATTSRRCKSADRSQPSNHSHRLARAWYSQSLQRGGCNPRTGTTGNRFYRIGTDTLVVTGVVHHSHDLRGGTSAAASSHTTGLAASRLSQTGTTIIRFRMTCYGAICRLTSYLLCNTSDSRVTTTAACPLTEEGVLIADFISTTIPCLHTE